MSKISEASHGNSVPSYQFHLIDLFLQSPLIPHSSYKMILLHVTQSMPVYVCVFVSGGREPGDAVCLSMCVQPYAHQ